jgi:hypothetical protein
MRGGPPPAREPAKLADLIDAGDVHPFNDAHRRADEATPTANIAPDAVGCKRLLGRFTRPHACWSI